MLWINRGSFKQFWSGVTNVATILFGVWSDGCGPHTISFSYLPLHIGYGHDTLIVWCKLFNPSIGSCYVSGILVMSRQGFREFCGATIYGVSTFNFPWILAVRIQLTTLLTQFIQLKIFMLVYLTVIGCILCQSERGGCLMNMKIGRASCS